jgi:hypothetical protein
MRKNNSKPGKKKKNPNAQDHNPADEGLDHNLLKGGDEDYEDSYLDKQEARGTRGIDNEETTDTDAVDPSGA